MLAAVRTSTERNAGVSMRDRLETNELGKGGNGTRSTIKGMLAGADGSDSACITLGSLGELRSRVCAKDVVE